MKPYKTSPLAFGFVALYKRTFSDRLEGVPRYLKGMKIWNGRYKGRPKFGDMSHHFVIFNVTQYINY